MTADREKAPGATVQISFEDNKLVQQLAGERNSHLKVIEKQLDVRVHL